MCQELEDQSYVTTTKSPRLIDDVFTQTFPLLTAKHLSRFATTDKHYRLLVHKYLFSSSRQSPEDFLFQAQLLKKWGHCPDYLLSKNADWESILRKYVCQPLIPYVNRVYALICLTIIAVQQKNKDKYWHYLNLLIIHTEGHQLILNAALYLIAQYNNNVKLRKVCSNTLIDFFKLGFHYDDSERYDDHSNDRFYELRLFSFTLAADIVNDIYPVNPADKQYALQAITLTADHFTTTALKPQLNLYIDRLLSLFPIVSYNEIAARHFNLILKRLLPLLTKSQLYQFKTAIHEHLVTAAIKLIEASPSDRTLDKTILNHVIIWYEPFMLYLDDTEIKMHRKLLLGLLDKINSVDITYFCYQWQKLMGHHFKDRAKQKIKMLIKRCAIAHIHHLVTKSPFCLSALINIGICLIIVDAQNLNPEIDQYIYAQLLQGNLKPIIMSTELDRSLADIWPHISDTTRSLLLSEIVAVYPKGDYKQKKSIALAIKSIASTLSNKDKVICLKLLIQDDQFFIADAEFIEYTKIVCGTCRILSQNNSDPELVDIANEWYNKLVATPQINKSNLANFYFNLTILLAIKPSISEPVANKIAAQITSALALHIRSLGNSGSPRVVRNVLVETINYIYLLVYVIPFLDQKQIANLILETAQIILPFFEQLYNSSVRNICYRPLLHAILELLQLNKCTLLEEHKIPIHFRQADNSTDHQACDATNTTDLNKTTMVPEKSESLSSIVEATNAQQVIDTLASLILRRRNIDKSLLFVPLVPEELSSNQTSADNKPVANDTADHLQKTQLPVSILSEATIQLSIDEQPIRTNPGNIAQPVYREVEIPNRLGDSPRSESDRQLQQRM